MKWFQHHSNAHKSLKFQKLLEKFGWEGYGAYWICLELVAEQGRNYNIAKRKRWKDYLKQLIRFDDEKLDKFLYELAEANLINKKALKGGSLYIPKLKEYSDDWTKKLKRRKEFAKFPKTEYIKIEQAYVRLKKIKPQGDEWLPIQREIKIMFRSGRSSGEIIKCMKWMTENDFYKDKWIITTVRKKLPEFLSGRLEEEVKIPNYAKN